MHKSSSGLKKRLLLYSIILKTIFTPAFAALQIITQPLYETLVPEEIRPLLKNKPHAIKTTISQQFPQTRFRLAHFQLIKNDFIADEQSQTAAISAVGFNDR
ncbi:hypothetical protein [Endozoicomonas sp. Mp262]|uniref:hypothetical protein n=1 Tax=Endozoicomonas sp. Mp262 TaxID=2919499 RepID=UPI0021D99921